MKSSDLEHIVWNVITYEAMGGNQMSGWVISHVGMAYS